MSLTVEPQVQAVRIELTVPGGHDRLTVDRYGPSGVGATVRAISALAVTPGGFIGRDFEAPIGVPLDYFVWTWPVAGGEGAGGGGHLGTITIPDGGCEDTWLTDLVRAGNTQQVVIEALDELAHDVPAGVHRILNRRTPIVTSDVAWSPAFELDFLTATDQERERARAILGNGVPVLLRTPPANGVGSMYFAVTGFSEERIVKPAREPARRFSVAAVQVDRPDPTLFAPLPPTDYADVTATYATYAALKAARANYDAVQYDYSGLEAGDVVPWPPSDV